MCNLQLPTRSMNSAEHDFNNCDSCWHDYNDYVLTDFNVIPQLARTMWLHKFHPPHILPTHTPHIHTHIYKVKWSRHRPSVAQRVVSVITLLFHDRGTRRWWVVSSTPRPHFNLEKNQYPFYRRLGGPQGWSGRAENLVCARVCERDRGREKVFYLTTSVAKTAIVVHDTWIWETGGVIWTGEREVPGEKPVAVPVWQRISIVWTIITVEITEF